MQLSDDGYLNNKIRWNTTEIKENKQTRKQ